MAESMLAWLSVQNEWNAKKQLVQRVERKECAVTDWNEDSEAVES